MSEYWSSLGLWGNWRKGKSEFESMYYNQSVGDFAETKEVYNNMEGNQTSS